MVNQRLYEIARVVSLVCAQDILSLAKESENLRERFDKMISKKSD